MNMLLQLCVCVLCCCLFAAKLRDTDSLLHVFKYATHMGCYVFDTKAFACT